MLTGNADHFLFIVNSLGAGGAERSLLDLLAEARRRGLKTTLLTLSRVKVGFEDEARRAEHDVRLIGGSSWLRRVVEVRRVILEIRPALVYTTLFEADVVGRLAAIRTGIPVVSGLVNTNYDAARLQDPAVRKWRLILVQLTDRWTARHLTRHFHAISEAVKESAIRDLRIAPSRITVVPRGRDASLLGAPSQERRDRVRRREGIHEDAFVFITVGRQEYQKGHEVLVRAFAEVAASHSDPMLLIVGREGHATAATLSLIDQLGLSGRVRLLGHRSNVPDLLACADAFVFPSLYEGLGGAVIEAMALSLPIVASDLAALNEVTTEQGSLRVPPGDPSALAEAMRTIMESTHRDELGSHNRDRFMAEFRSEPANERLLDLLADVSRSSRR